MHVNKAEDQKSVDFPDQSAIFRQEKAIKIQNLEANSERFFDGFHCGQTSERLCCLIFYLSEIINTASQGKKIFVTVENFFT